MDICAVIWVVPSQQRFNCFTSGICQVYPSWDQCHKCSPLGSVQEPAANMTLSGHMGSHEFWLHGHMFLWLRLPSFTSVYMSSFPPLLPLCLCLVSSPGSHLGWLLWGNGSRGHGVSQPGFWSHLHFLAQLKLCPRGGFILFGLGFLNS